MTINIPIGGITMIYGGIITVLVALDLAVKWLIEQQDMENFPRPIKNTKEKIWLYRSHNAGFPFGFLKEYRNMVRTVSLIFISALGGVLCYLIPKKGSRIEKIGLSVALGGALSNLFDRYVRGYVVDYLSIRRGALKKIVFNLGDVMVFAGLTILFCTQFFQDLRQTDLHHSLGLPVDRTRETLYNRIQKS